MPNVPKISQALGLIKDLYGELKPFRESLKTSQKIVTVSLDRAVDSFEPNGIFSSDDKNINKIRAVAIVYNQELSTMAQKDENFWFEWSNVNAFSTESRQKSVNELSKLVNILQSISDAIPSLIALVITSEAVSSWEKKLVYLFTPSNAIIEAQALKETTDELKLVQYNVGRILPKINKAIDIIK